MRRCLSIVLNTFTNDSRVLRESETLAKNGFKVTVFALHEDKLPLKEEHAFLSLRRSKLRTRGWSKRKPVQLIKYVECVVRMVAAGVRVWPTVVHANDWDALPIGYLIARLTGAKLIYDAHELWRDPGVRGDVPAAPLDLGVRLEGWLARRADGVMTVSESIAADMAEKMRIVKPQVVRNLPLAKQSAVLPGSDEERPLRRELGLSDRVPIVLYQGGVSVRKGVEILLEAFRWVNPPTVLVYLGYGPQVSSLKQRAKELEITDRVFFHPAVPPKALLNYTADATVGVIPTKGGSLNYQYCLPNKLFESLQAGLPVVVSDLPEMAAVVKRYGVGEVFPDGDAESLARTLNTVLGEPERLKLYTEAANLAAQELNWEREESKFLEVYKDALLST